MGKQGTNTGWWTLMLNTNGNVLSFVTQTNGVGMTNFNALVNLNSNLWHQIVLTYGTSNSVLYLDGRAITNGTGVQYYPNATERANGFRVGSDESGTNQARGIFDELETFNYALTASVILANYNQVSTESSAIGSSYFSILLVAPTNNAAYAEPATILLQASVVDLDSTATNVEFFRGFIGITGTATIPYQYSWPIVAAGQYSLTAVAYGAGGLSVTSAPVSITVTNLCGN
jgi:hypothetical protein